MLKTVWTPLLKRLLEQTHPALRLGAQVRQALSSQQVSWRPRTTRGEVDDTTSITIHHHLQSRSLCYSTARPAPLHPHMHPRNGGFLWGALQTAGEEGPGEFSQLEQQVSAPRGLGRLCAPVAQAHIAGVASRD